MSTAMSRREQRSHKGQAFFVASQPADLGLICTWAHWIVILSISNAASLMVPFILYLVPVLKSIIMLVITPYSDADNARNSGCF